MALSAEALIFKLHGCLLRELAVATSQPFEGLEQSGRVLRKQRVVSNKSAKKLAHLDHAFNIARHITEVKANLFVASILNQVTKHGSHKGDSRDLEENVEHNADEMTIKDLGSEDKSADGDDDEIAGATPMAGPSSAEIATDMTDNLTEKLYPEATVKFINEQFKQQRGAMCAKIPLQVLEESSSCAATLDAYVEGLAPTLESSMLSTFPTSSGAKWFLPHVATRTIQEQCRSETRRVIEFAIHSRVPSRREAKQPNSKQARLKAVTKR